MNPRLSSTTKGTALVALASFALALAPGCKTGRYDDASEGRSSLTDGLLDGDSGSAGELGQDAEGAGGGAALMAAIPDSRTISMAFPTGERATSAVLLEKEVPGEVILGSEFEYRISVQNLTDRALDTVRVMDSIPDGFEVSATEPQSSVAGGIATWSLGALAPRSTKVLSVRGRAMQVGKLTTCASVEYESSLCATLSVVSPAINVAIDAPDEAMACDTFDVTVTVTNDGTGDARDITVINELPEGLTTLGGQSRILMDFDTLNSGQDKSKTVKLRAARAGAFTQTVKAEGASGLSAASAPATTILREPRLALTMESEPESLAGRPLVTTMRLANTGDGVSKDTMVRVKLPQSAAVVSSSEGSKKLSSGILEWSLGELEPGASRDLRYEIKGMEQGMLVSEARASGYCAEEETATARTEVRGRAALLLEVTDQSDLILVGESVVYDIIIENQGSAPDTNIVIVADVEEGIEVLSTGGDAESQVVDGQITFDPIPSLAPGEKATLRVTVRSNKEFDSRFKVSLTSTQKQRPVQETEATNFIK